MNLPEEYEPLVLNALEHYVIYLRAVTRDDSPYVEIVKFFKRKVPAKADPERLMEKKRA